MDGQDAMDAVRAELEQGMALAKCRQCGCMRETLEALQGALPALATEESGTLSVDVERWLAEMQPIKYACLGCDYCLAGAALNVFHQAFPDAAQGQGIGCAFEVRPQAWPALPGEYLVLGSGGSNPVAVSTLGNLDLPEQLAALAPSGLALVGKTETENIGIDKVVKNVVANSALRYLVLTGEDSAGHYPGATLLALAQNGVNDKMRVIGSPGKRPVLRNVTRDEVEAFRRQVQVVDMIGCTDAHAIAAKVAELAGEAAADLCNDPACGCHASVGISLPIAPVTLSISGDGCGCDGLCLEDARALAEPQAALAICGCSGLCPEAGEDTHAASNTPVIQAQAPEQVQLDRAGYFVIILQRERGMIVAEHYGYDDQLLHTLEGRDARSIYWTIINSGWVSQLSHAAYLGKELAKAELALAMGFKYVQDGA